MKTVDLLSRKLHIKFYRQFCGFQGASNYLGVKFVFTDWVLIRAGVSEAAGFGGMAGIWTRRPKAGTRVPALTCSTEYYSFFGLELFLVTAHELFADILWHYKYRNWEQTFKNSTWTSPQHPSAWSVDLSIEQGINYFRCCWVHMVSCMWQELVMNRTPYHCSTGWKLNTKAKNRSFISTSPRSNSGENQNALA